MTAYKTKLQPIAPEDAERAAKPIMEDAKKNLGMVPNLYRNMANVPELLETYTVGYQGFRKHSGLTPAEQEVILLSVSFENACTYCMAVHSFMADKMSNVPEEVTNAIRDGKEVPDPKLRALSELTREVVRTRGWPSEERVRAFLDAGYEESQLLHVLLGVAVKTISNYTNHLFGTPLDEPFQGRAWQSPER
ncbi:MAG: carboxymuconolactone decarboxylase family protein [Myxococcota bacterium]